MCIQRSVHLRSLLVAAEWLEVAQSIVQVSRTNENIEDLNGYWRYISILSYGKKAFYHVLTRQYRRLMNPT